MIRKNLLKIRHQPQLIGVFIMMLMYGLFFALRMHSQPNNKLLWFNNGLLYLTCLTPFLLSLIIAIQRKFEDQRHNLNNVLSLPSRHNWLLTFSFETLVIWILNVLLFNLIFIFVSPVSIVHYVNLWMKLVPLSIIWIPLLVTISIFFGYLAVLIVSAVSLPFMIYYGTTMLGQNIWKFVPWLYSAKISIINIKQFFMALFIVIFVTFVEQMISDYYFDRW